MFTTALIPFSTAVLAEAIQQGDVADTRTASALYSLVGALGTVSWFWFFHYLSAHRGLLRDDASERFFAAERGRAVLGLLLYSLAAVLAYVLNPVLALVMFFGLSVFYAVTSDGPFQKPALRQRRT